MALGTISQLEFLDDIIPETAVAKVSHTDTATVYVVLQYILKIVAGEVIDNEQTLALTLHQLLFIAQLSFFNFDIILLGKVSQCLRIRHLFVRHDKVHGVAPLSAGETFAESFSG